MFSIFKKKKNEKSSTDNEFLDIEASMYSTEADANSFQDSVNYQNLVYQPLEQDTPKYKAVRNNIGVVIDKDQFGYDVNDFNSNITTYELEKSTDEEKVEVKQEKLEEPKKIYNPIEELMTNDIQDETDTNSSLPVQELYKAGKEEKDFSIFGSKIGPENEKIHEAKKDEEKPVELIEEVRFTPDGHKICPNCATILKADAPICFMCSKSFIKKW